MEYSKNEVYISDGPRMERAVKAGAKGPGESYSSQSAKPAGGATSPEIIGPGQSQIEAATIGGMTVVNQINVTGNQDGTFQMNVAIADATPETGPVASRPAGPVPQGSAGTPGVRTGWVRLGTGYKYCKADGSGYKTGWHEEKSADGTSTWYYLDTDPGHIEWMVTGWKKIKGAGGEYWYHFREDGKMSVYWELLKGMWYYLEPHNNGGNMIMGWKEINAYRYYFIPEEDAGYMMIEWHEIDGQWYYFYNSDEKRGIMAVNHMVNHTDGEKYYLGADGAMVVSITFKSEEDGKTYTADEDGVCTREESKIGKEIEEILLKHGYNISKAHSMAMAYEACNEKKYDRNFAVGMMANIFHEGAAGKLENYGTADYWKLAPQNIINLSGKILKNEDMTRTWLKDTPRVSGFGVGSIQWSAPERRDGILNQYLKSAETWSSEELSEIEVQFMIRELEGKDYKDFIEVLPNCKDKSVTFCADHICRHYEIPSKINSRARERKLEATKLDGILSNYGY